VPAEMKEMWSATVGPAVAALQPEPRLIRHKQIKCFGVGESDLEAMLPDLIARQREPLVGITVSQATITLRVTASGRTPAECDAAMQPTIDTIHQCLGDLIFGYDDDELQHAVVRLLRERQQSLATLECGTGGLIAHWLTKVPKADDVYRGGQVVTRELFGTAQSERVSHWFKQTQNQFKPDYTLLVGPFPLTAETPPDHVQIGLATNDEIVTSAIAFTGHPDILKARMAKCGLNFLRLKLLRNTQ
jgi:nicotinamide-nucleotide amidase